MTLGNLGRRMRNRLRALIAPVPEIPAALWLDSTRHYPFLAALALPEQARLRALSALFLQHKEFTGAHGLVVTDAMAVAIAAQACLPLLHWGAPRKALAWYDDFVGIVVHPGDALARRQMQDASGVVHDYSEVLQGEAMERGPIMLSWPAVHDAGRGPHAQASSVVIHEFVHKIDMKNGAADGFPPLPGNFMGAASARAARRAWHAAWQPAYERLRDQVAMAQRFGAAWPWLDAYGATNPAEFFAVACEAYFVDRPRFAQEFPSLLPVLDAFFQRPAAAG